MQYVLLLYGNEQTPLTPEELQSRIAEHAAIDAELAARGIFRGGAALRQTAMSTTVRSAGGRVLTTDGPFAETKEQLGGLYIIDCDNLDEAIAIAARMPAAKYGGSVEIRPVWSQETC